MSGLDPTLALQGEISLFAWRRDDLTDPPTFVGLFGRSIVDGLNQPLGDLSPVQVPSPSRANEFDIARITRGAPDLGEITIVERVRRTTLGQLERISRLKCPYVFAMKLGNCGRPDDFADFGDSMIIVDYGLMSELDYGTLGQFDAEDPLEFTGTISYLTVDRIFPLVFGEQAEALILAEVLDVAYADEFSCGSCAPFNSGCDVLFALTAANSGSPGLSSQMVVTRDGGDTYTKYDIAALGGLSGSAMAGVGSKLVVVSEALGGHVYAPKSDVSASQWVAVTSGYQVGGGPRCITSSQPQRTFIGGAGGYIYELDNPVNAVTVSHDATLTSQNSNAIHTVGEIVASAHNSNTILLSTNAGQTWSLVVGPSVGDDLTAIWVINANQLWVGTDAGELYFTEDGGDNWTQRLLPQQTQITAIYDIKFSEGFSQLGAIAIQKTATAEVYRTNCGGREWYRESPQIVQLTTAPERYTKLALCSDDHIAAAGLQAGSTDGVLAVALGPA